MDITSATGALALLALQADCSNWRTGAWTLLAIMAHWHNWRIGATGTIGALAQLAHWRNWRNRRMVIISATCALALPALCEDKCAQLDAYFLKSERRIYNDTAWHTGLRHARGKS